MIFLNKIMLLALTLYFFAISWDIFVELNHSTYNLLFKNHSLSEVVYKDGLPYRIEALASLVRSSSLKDYKISIKNFSKEFKMQIVVATWPVHENVNSKHVFFLSTDVISNDCKIMKKRNEVTLALCL